MSIVNEPGLYSLVLGYQLLRKTTIQSAIQEAIEQRQQRTEVTQDYVIQKLKEITK